MDGWEIELFGKKKDLGGSILIAGLPGIGNVGKIVTDFLIDELKAEKICEFSSYHMPHSVFVNPDNITVMPKISLFFKMIKKTKLLILTGDSQPADEVGCYSFCDTMLDFFTENKGREIITLGGIGLDHIPKEPKVFCTGNDREIIEKYMKGTSMNGKVFGVVGPIIGVSGLLLGLSGKRKIKSVSVLAETFGHPMFLGLKGAREILKILDSRFKLGIKLKNLEKEIDSLESRMKVTDEIGKTVKKRGKDTGDVSYIG
jgi:proteasome assembly chaperone (PAC2) family protein